MCNIIRTDKELEQCPYCYQSYLFFAKTDIRIDVYANRINEGEDLEFMDN
jgi:hypothetical protein